MTFKHQLGYRAESKTTGLAGVVTARSENLYGCNRYFVQPPVDKDGKVPDGWWIDEDDVQIVGPHLERQEKATGGPMSRTR